MQKSFNLIIPCGPSVNGLFATDFRTKRRFITKAYADWIKLATQYAPKTLFTLKGDVRAEYVIARKDKRRQDISNREKALSDLLVKWGVLQDDSQIVDIRLRWAKPEDGLEPGWARLTLTPVD